MANKRHEDLFMWNTIQATVPEASDEVKEKIYDELFGTTWTIYRIAVLAEMYS